MTFSCLVFVHPSTAMEMGKVTLPAASRVMTSAGRSAASCAWAALIAARLGSAQVERRCDDEERLHLCTVSQTMGESVLGEHLRCCRPRRALPDECTMQGGIHSLLHQRPR